MTALVNLLKNIFNGKANGWQAFEDWLDSLVVEDIGKYTWDTPAGKLKVNVDYKLGVLRVEYSPLLGEDVWLYNAKQDRWYPAAPGTPRKLPWEWTWE